MSRRASWLVLATAVGTLVAFGPDASAGKPPPPPSVPVVELGSANYSRTESGGFASITVVRNKNIASPSSVSLSLSPGTAAEPADYVDPAGAGVNVVTIPANSTAVTFDVAIVDDLIDEPNETVNLTLVNAVSNAQIGKRKTAKLTITDNDPSTSVSINSPAGVNEGSPITFTITPTGASSQVMGVTATTVAGTAASPGDYVFTTQNYSWAVGDATTRSFAVTTNAADGDEPTQAFTVLLSNLHNVSGGGSGTGTILDTDASPTFSVGDASVSEGPEPGTTLLSFPVSVSGPLAALSEVTWITAANGSATGYPIFDSLNSCANVGTDYVSAIGTLTFVASLTTPASQNANVVICGDNDYEGDETFSLWLLGATYGTATDTATGTISDDDTTAEAEPNNDYLTATAVPAASSMFLTGAWSNSSDAEFFAITVPSAGTIHAYSVDVVGGACSTFTSDPVLALYGTDGVTQLLYNDDGGGAFCADLSYAVPTAGTYFLQVNQTFTFDTPWGTRVTFTP